MGTKRYAWLIGGLLAGSFVLMGQGGLGGGGGNPCSGFGPDECLQLRDSNADGNVGDDFVRVFNTLRRPGGLPATTPLAYMAAPPCGTYEISTQVVDCADADHPTGTTIPDCTGTSEVLPNTIEWIGDWECSTFRSTVVVDTTSARTGTFVFGDAHRPSGAVLDGFAPLGAAMGSGEVRHVMNSTLRIQMTAQDYSGNPGLSAPAPFACNGCRGVYDVGILDDGDTSYALSGVFINAEQDFSMRLRMETSPAKADLGQRFGVGCGPGNMFGGVLTLETRRAGIYNGGSSGSGGCGYLTIHPRIETNRADTVSPVNFQRWKNVTIADGWITILPAQNGAPPVNTAPAIDFSVSGNASAGQFNAKMRNLRVQCLADTNNGAGCIRLTGCGTTTQSRYTLEGVDIVMNGDSYTGAGVGGIEVVDSNGTACTGVDLAPIVSVSDTTFVNTGATSTVYLFPDDASPTANRKGFFLADESMGGDWRRAVMTQSTDLTAERCFNLLHQDPAVGEELLPCTDARTMIHAIDTGFLFAIGVRVSNAGAALAAGNGCAIYPRLAGTSESGTNGIGHTIVTGQTGLEANGDTDWVYVNRPVTAGQTIQVAIADSLGADNVAGGTGANADEQCQGHVDTRVQVHFTANLPHPKFTSTPFGAGN